MGKARSAISGAVLALATLGTVFTGCAGDVGEIDRVQPDYLKKSDLVGKSWYFRRTVVDMPESMNSTWYGAWLSIGGGDMFVLDRVKWEIQEDYLIAYRDFEYIPGTDDGQMPGTEYKGTPIVAYPIQSHFDITHSYNPQTNEQTNVREENMSDRPWSERDYIRVSWHNMVYNDWIKDMFVLPVDLLDTDGHAGGSKIEYSDDALSPWHAKLTPEKGIIDFVTDHIVIPDLYTCYYEFEFQNPWEDCASGEVRIRNYFITTDQLDNPAYKPLYYPDSVVLKDANGDELSDPETNEVMREPIFERFGYFRLERLTYDHERELTESGRIFRAVRFDIWEESVDADGNDIPYAERTPRPIHYYLNWDFPAELADTADVLAREWSDVFKVTVAKLQGKSVNDVPDMFVLHQNSCNVDGVRAYLDAHDDVAEKVYDAMGGGRPLADQFLQNWCAATEYFSRHEDDAFGWEQIGDPRFSMLYYLNTVVPSGWAGLGPSFADPISGRAMSATSYIMGWTIEMGATRALEYVDYLNGDLTLEHLLRGTDAPSDMLERDLAAEAHDLQSVAEAARRVPSAEHLAELRTRVEAQRAAPGGMMKPLENGEYYRERLSRVFGSDLERDFLTTPEDMMLATRGAWRPGMTVTDELVYDSSAMRRMHDVVERRRHTQRVFGENTMCPLPEFDDTLVGMAKQLKCLGSCDDACFPGSSAPLNCEEASREEKREMRRSEIKREYFRAVALHEIGHNVGLRHNFEGSYDALNYKPEFWDIELESSDDAEKYDKRQPEYRYSTVMDYGGRINSDFMGLGLYDYAAVKFGYGQLVETFDSPPTFQGNQLDSDELRAWRLLHDYRELLQDSSVDGFDDGHGSLFSSRAQVYGRTDVSFDWTTPKTVSEVAQLKASEVPYMFCSDEFAGLTPTCRTSDYGANQREIAEAARVRYKNYFIFDRYLRNRLTLDWDRALARGQMAFDVTKLQYQYFYLYNYLLESQGFASSDSFADYSSAVENGLNLISEVIAMPVPTRYSACTDPVTSEKVYYHLGYIDYDPLVSTDDGIGPYGETCAMDDEIELELGQAFPLYFGFSEDYIAWTFTYLGTFWDKMAALDALTYPGAYFPRVNIDEDNRYYSVGLYRLFPQELNDLMMALIEFKPAQAASYWDADSGDLVARPFVMDGALPAGATAKVVPALARNLQLYALLFGMAYMSSPMDNVLDFSKTARIALKGSGEDFVYDTVAPELRVECTLPEGGRTYRAVRQGSAYSRDDVGYNFVASCVEQVDDMVTRRAEWDAAKAALVGNEADPVLVQAEYKAELEYMLANDRLRATEQNMVFTRQLVRQFEYGNGL